MYNAVVEVRFVEQSTYEPVTLEEVKEWCRIDSDLTADDTLLETIIKAARISCEGYTNRSFVNHDIEAVLRNECGNILLPYCPIAFDSNEADVLFYDEDGENITDKIELVGTEFPYIKNKLEYIKAVYSTGAELPKDLKTALLMQVAFMYENRGDIKVDFNPLAKTLMAPYRLVL
jgi:hypothetical protein